MSGGSLLVYDHRPPGPKRWFPPALTWNCTWRRLPKLPKCRPGAIEAKKWSQVPYVAMLCPGLWKHTKEIGHQKMASLVAGHPLWVFFAHHTTQRVQQQQLTSGGIWGSCKTVSWQKKKDTKMIQKRLLTLFSLIQKSLSVSVAGSKTDPRHRILCWWPATCPKELMEGICSKRYYFLFFGSYHVSLWTRQDTISSMS